MSKIIFAVAVSCLLLSGCGDEKTVIIKEKDPTPAPIVIEKREEARHTETTKTITTTPGGTTTTKEEKTTVR